MTLQEILNITGDSHCKLASGAVTVDLQADESDYWHLSDFAVTTRSGMMLVMVPRCLPQASHADNGWQHHYKRES